MLLVLFAVVATARGRNKASIGGFFKWIGSGSQGPHQKFKSAKVPQNVTNADETTADSSTAGLLKMAEDALAAGNLTAAERLIAKLEQQVQIRRSSGKKPVRKSKPAVPTAKNQTKPTKPTKETKSAAPKNQTKPVEPKAKPLEPKNQTKPATPTNQTKPIQAKSEQKPVKTTPTTTQKETKSVAGKEAAKPAAEQKQARPVVNPTPPKNHDAVNDVMNGLKRRRSQAKRHRRHLHGKSE